jgi:protein phosphatase 1 regulatory subunit 7
MSIINIEGFKIFNEKTSGKILIVDSDRIEEGMNFFNEAKLDGISISRVHGYKLNDIDFLKDYSNIKHVSISEEIMNIEGIYHLKELTKLIISGKKRKVDFSIFKNLKELITDWSPFFINMDACHKLEKLYIYNYKPDSRCLTEISNVPWLKSLKISQSTITSLRGLKQFSRLEELSFNYCSKLQELCDLEGSDNVITTLLFEKCKSIVNFEYVKKMKNLKVLAFNYCGEIPSIQFIQEMPNIEDFRFVGTNVLDGDLSPLKRLKFAGFLNKKHYSISYEELAKLHGHTVGL